MLIVSPRHRREDLELWSELETADRQCPISRQVDEALAAIRSFLRTGDRPYCAVSWGKDSTALAHLMSMIDPTIPLVYLKSIYSNPDCERVRRAYFASHPQQESRYEEYEVRYTLPDNKRATPAEIERLAELEWNRALRGCRRRFGRRYLLGVRAQESRGRRIRIRVWGSASPNACAPLGLWRTEHVFAFLAQHDLPVHPAYACLGGGRWNRAHIRVDELGGLRGESFGRTEWEKEYYASECRRIESVIYHSGGTLWVAAAKEGGKVIGTDWW